MKEPRESHRQRVTNCCHQGSAQSMLAITTSATSDAMTDQGPAERGLWGSAGIERLTSRAHDETCEGSYGIWSTHESPAAGTPPTSSLGASVGEERLQVTQSTAALVSTSA